MPAGSIVIPNLFAAHHDPKIWDRPAEFLPGMCGSTPQLWALNPRVGSSLYTHSLTSVLPHRAVPATRGPLASAAALWLWGTLVCGGGAGSGRALRVFGVHPTAIPPGAAF